MPVNTSSNSASLDRYRCPICQDLLIEPVTVNCGHSFCHLCLAKWTLQCGQNKCAHCSQIWTGQPHVNIVLRETIQDTFTSAYHERAERHAMERDIVNRFNSLQQTKHPTLPEQSNLIQHGYTAGVYVLLVVAVILYLLGYAPPETYMTKRVETWTFMDSVQWLESFGDWPRANVLRRLARQNLDGKFLLELAKNSSQSDESLLENIGEHSFGHDNSEFLTLEDIMADETDEHQELLRKAFKYILSKDRVPPRDLWEYKAAFPIRSRFFVEMAFPFPRLATLALYLVDYKETFLPLIHCVTGNGINSVYETEIPEPTMAQYLDFMWRLAIFPLTTIYSKFLLTVLWSTNFWAMLYLVLRACFQITLELRSIFLFLQDQNRRYDLLGRFFRDVSHTCYFLSSFSTIILIMPSGLTNIICSFHFYLHFIGGTLTNGIEGAAILYLFYQYIKREPNHVIWQDVKSLVHKAGQLLQFTFQFTKDKAKHFARSFPNKCKTVGLQGYALISKVSQFIMNYALNNAIDDAWSLVRHLQRIVKRICVWLYKKSFGRFTNNPQ